MNKKKIFKRFFITFSVILIIFVLIFLTSDLVRYTKSFHATNNNGERVVFDSQITNIMFKVDRKLAKEGYETVSHTVDSDNDHGGIEMMDYNGVGMRLVKLTANYARQVQVISHEKTPYQKFVLSLENLLGRLPPLFYALDKVEYIGEREEKLETATVELRFMLIKDNKDRIFGGNYYTYACTMCREDLTTYTFYDDAGFFVDEYSTKNIREGRNFDGDLEWLKSKAYNNYVSRMVLDSAFQWYE